MPRGAYSISSERLGFKNVTVSPVTARVNQTVRVDLNRAVGDTAGSVTAQEYPSLVLADTPNTGQVVSARQLAGLPPNRRACSN